MNGTVLRNVICAGALAAATACTTAWHREPIATLAGLEEHDQAEVWVGGQAQLLRGIQVRGDTLFAVPYYSALDCRDCGVRIRLSSVDSVRYRHYERLTADQQRQVFVPAVFIGLLALTIVAAVAAASAAAFGGCC